MLLWVIISNSCTIGIWEFVPPPCLLPMFTSLGTAPVPNKPEGGTISHPSKAYDTADGAIVYIGSTNESKHLVQPLQGFAWPHIV